MSSQGIKYSLRDFLPIRRIIVTFGVAGTIGVVEWLALGHPIGLAFGLIMGLMALLVSPLPWLWILPWGMRRPLPEIVVRATAVLQLSALIVVLPFSAFFWALQNMSLKAEPLLWNVTPALSDWTSMVVSIPLFTAAGWGISRHLELERRLEVRDGRELALLGALEEARMMALQSRLDPHFLFNALNLVAELCREEPEEAERCVVRLSGLLRAALEHGEQPMIPLSRELDLCADYLDLCGVRFGDRLQVEISRDPAAEEARTPLFSVQVLCENAVRHGIERTPGGGCVRIVTRADTKTASVCVYNPGPLGEQRAGGKGIELTRRRLALALGQAASLELRTMDDGEQTRAELLLPLQSAPAQARQEEHP